ncbi:UvrD-helicase domain-containing protein [Piscinibacter sp. Jin2]|uniref:RecBCD enzyme subunit RecB n=1 Tax=Aquariibacter lacus TaxID=2801332 RepID=A0A9X0XDX9_9BURK|nr:UvrD-helicase domain-containing protein [Piscinibacter lacus]MBL0720522.1 UvrD-helicase domain-containing protein [Piscinibacter lacus]
MSAPLLDPLRLPLRGSRLIEASAGTGKTYTLAALVLRLVLGHGGEAGPPRPLLPPEILVLTYTEAATEELRERIRARLHEASEAFTALADAQARGEPPPALDEPLLRALREDLPPADWPAAAQRLRLACAWMDEAAIHTLHGWCTRVLREHAFDSGSLFALTVDPEPERVQAEALRDWWRLHARPLPLPLARRLAAWWPTPEALGRALAPLRMQPEALGPGLPPQAALAEADRARRTTLARLRQPWRAPALGGEGWADTLLGALNAAVAAKQLRMDRRATWVEALRCWAETPDTVEDGTDEERAGVLVPDEDGAADLPAGERPRLRIETAWPALEAFAQARMAEGDPHPLWPALAGLRAALDALPDGRDAILAQALRWTLDQAEAERQRRALLDFDGLLRRLDAALQGPRGPALAARLRAQHPVALIDEFQDTDPVQLRIVDAIYGLAADAQDRALLMIGDPKQAIYAFRGADLPTYLQARRATAGRHATLGTNFRSTPGMVAAVNTVFAQAEARPGGAFGLGEALPFTPVAALGRRERWWTAEAAAPAPLTVWTLPAEGGKPLGDGLARERLAAGCAAEIARLLAEGAAGRAGFVPGAAAEALPAAPPPGLRPLRPGDVAVLVNTGTEAQAVRSALDALGVRSVYLSDRGSVFDSPQAGVLQRWLQAAATPEDGAALRAALATAPLGLDWATLEALSLDEAAWEAELARFQALQARWRRHGVLPMLHRLMQDFGVAPRLLAGGDERGLTDLMHLAELLQGAEATLDGPAALIRWLGRQREAPRGDADARRLRLESDADRVQVVTVHKSKGLEYPLVFLPFAAFFKAEKRHGAQPLRWHDAEGRLRASTQPDAAARATAEAERVQEDLRKLYVALTRARHATWLGVAPLKTLRRSALGHLLVGGGAAGGGSAGDVDEEEDADRSEALLGPALDAALGAWTAACPSIVCAPLPEAAEAHRAAPPAPPRLRPAPPLPQPRRRWWIASYSALRHAAQAAPATRTLDLLPEPAREPLPPEAPSSASAATYAEGPDRPVAAATPGLLPWSDEAQPARPLSPRGPDEARAAGSLPPRGITADLFAGLDATPAAPAPASAAAAATTTTASTPAGPPAAPPTPGRLHTLARGAAPGTFLHSLLEWAGQRGFARLAADPALQAEARTWLAPRAARFGDAALADTLHAWLLDWLRTPLPLGPGRGAVAPQAFGSSAVELEFWFAATAVDAAALDRLVSTQVFPGAPRPALAPQALDGMLKGFIDLVFEYDGRWYVADHKSNALGEDESAYGPAALQAAALDSRYELQALLYLLALHRLLRIRKPGYDYERDVGGALVLFLRGHAAPGGGVLAIQPPRVLIEALDALFAGRPGEPVAAAAPDGPPAPAPAPRPPAA